MATIGGSKAQGTWTTADKSIVLWEGRRVFHINQNAVGTVLGAVENRNGTSIVHLRFARNSNYLATASKDFIRPLNEQELRTERLRDGYTDLAECATGNVGLVEGADNMLTATSKQVVAEAKATKLFSGIVIGKDEFGNSTGIIHEEKEILAEDNVQAERILLIRAVKAEKVVDTTGYTLRVSSLEGNGY